MQIDQNKAIRNINDEIAGASHELINALLGHFAYSIADIGSWDELTEAEKKIMPKEIFNKLAFGEVSDSFQAGTFVYRELISGSKWVSIHKCIDKSNPHGDVISFADVTIETANPFIEVTTGSLCSTGEIVNERVATEEEKNLAIEKLKSRGYTWDAEKLKVVRLD